MNSQDPSLLPYVPGQAFASGRPFALAWIAYTAIILGFAAGIWIPNGLYKRMDFRSMYAAGELARTDPFHLYDLARQKQLEDTLVEKHDVAIPFGHLAADALLFVPLSLLPYRTAYLLVILANAILIIPCFLAARKEFSAIIPPWQPRAGLIFFVFMPTTIALAQGQDSVLLLLALCLAWRFLDRSQFFYAGLAIAGMLFKPHLAILIALLIAVRYGWRFIAGFAAGGAAMAAVCVPFLRHGGWKSWLGVLSGLSLASGNSRAQEAAMGIYSWAMPNLRGVLLLMLGHAVASHVLFVLVGVTSAVVLAWALVVARKLPPRNALVFSIVAALLVSYNLEPHDLVLLVLPMAMMETGTSMALARCRDVILGLPAALLIFMPSTPPGAGFTFMSIPLLAAAILLARTAGKVHVAPAMQQTGEPSVA